MTAMDASRRPLRTTTAIFSVFDAGRRVGIGFAGGDGSMA